MPSTSEAAAPPSARHSACLRQGFGRQDACVLGLGHAGVRIVERLASMPEAAWLRIAAADTDASVESAAVPTRLLVGAEWTDGLGCGGDLHKGQRAMSHKTSARIGEFLAGAEMVFVVGGFGGGTATAGAPVAARIARQAKALVVQVATIPFAFEGHGKIRLAERAAADLAKTGDVVLAIHNDLLFSSLPHSAPASECFAKANEEVARALLGVAEALRCQSMIPMDYSNLRSVFARTKSECGVGVGCASAAEGPDRCHRALERLLASPLLGGGRGLRDADAVVATICGGADLAIGEMRHAMEVLQRLAGARAQFVAGAGVDHAYAGKVQITAIQIKFDIAPEAEPSGVIGRRPRRAARGGGRGGPGAVHAHPELPLQNISRGVFTNTAPTMVGSEDLDIPTFQRRGVAIDDGR